MVNELFTTEYRGLANSICCSVNWISSIILLLTYSLVKVSQLSCFESHFKILIRLGFQCIINYYLDVF